MFKAVLAAAAALIATILAAPAHAVIRPNGVALNGSVAPTSSNVTIDQVQLPAGTP
ncbi:hypothetical protein LJ725_15110 [Reyranella aquatilis]|uniref:Uncharacterized protein n=1 Tax=Reyranella aquatilis TaxID=2035356 RepID=A0ABS8KW60_9HYPH|nr:hypothetical protein [Reyranella aquatilis]MCC8430303.1 hypothetical protein [Reyranella aquatilis]